MSAANASAPSPSLQEEMRAHEPSMEEILASIRRIIADDQTAPPLTRRDRDLRPRLEPRSEIEAPATPKAYSAPALNPTPAPEAEEAEPVSGSEDAAPQPAPVVEIRQLRLHRASPPPMPPEAPKAEDAPKAEEPEKEEDELEASLEPVSEEYPPALRDMGEEGLVSADTASSVASHFQALTAGMFLNDSGLLQQYAQEMMRPMLKQWLDDNLPVIVERLVRAEIERVARGGRR